MWPDLFEGFGNKKLKWVVNRSLMTCVPRRQKGSLSVTSITVLWWLVFPGDRMVLCQSLRSLFYAGLCSQATKGFSDSHFGRRSLVTCVPRRQKGSLSVTSVTVFW